jgi:hypothetical protein
MVAEEQEVEEDDECLIGRTSIKKIREKEVVVLKWGKRGRRRPNSRRPRYIQNTKHMNQTSNSHKLSLAMETVPL